MNEMRVTQRLCMHQVYSLLATPAHSNLRHGVLHPADSLSLSLVLPPAGWTSWTPAWPQSFTGAIPRPSRPSSSPTATPPRSASRPRSSAAGPRWGSWGPAGTGSGLRPTPPPAADGLRAARCAPSPSATALLPTAAARGFRRAGALLSHQGARKTAGGGADWAREGRGFVGVQNQRGGSGRGCLSWRAGRRGWGTSCGPRAGRGGPTASGAVKCVKRSGA
jgi:hypothetical protein